MQESSASSPHRSPLLEQARQWMRTKLMSIRTERSYLGWTERSLRFQRDKRRQWVHPEDMDGAQISEFLTHLAVQKNVSASTQNQGFSALLFRFREALKKEVTINAVRAKKFDRLPVVLSVDEVRRVLAQLPDGRMQLLGGLM